MKIIILALLSLFAASKSYANEYEVDGMLEKESKKLLAAYEILGGHHSKDLTIAGRQSSCKLDICAINFVTDNENLGFYAQMIAELGIFADGSPILAFAVHPKGATFNSGIPSIDLPEDGRTLSEDKLQIIGDRAHEALKILGWVGIDDLIVRQSECLAVDTQVTCRLNFKTDRENYGVLLQGHMNTMDDDMISVSAFTTDPNGV